MKHKRTICILLSVVLIFAFSLTAFAETGSTAGKSSDKKETAAASESKSGIADVSDSEEEAKDDGTTASEEKTETGRTSASEEKSETGRTSASGEKSDTAEVPVSDENADWTVMIYLCGTDLETKLSMASSNLEEIAATTPNDRVNVVIETGGTKEWHTENLGLTIDPDKTQRFHYDSDGFTLDEELPLENMSNADTLTDFIRYSAENFPAQKYLLVLWDHGGGSCVGLITDEKYNNCIMTLDQLELAVSRTGVTLEATVLDTCMMASLETAQALQSSCHYMIASEETVPGKGSDYETWLQYLYDMPECTGKLFGRRVCDSVQQKYAELGSQYDGVTFSVVDLTQLDPVTKAFNEVFAELRQEVDDPDYMLAFSTATKRTESYTSSDMIDLGDLVERARGLGIANETANALLTALSDAVIYNVRGVDHSYSTGLSFYYAPSANSLYLDRYVRSGKNPEYLAFIDRVNTAWSAPAWVYDEVDYLPDITYENYGIELETDVAENGELQLTVKNGVNAISSIDLELYSYKTEGDGDSDGRWIRLGHDPFGVDGDFSSGKFTAVIPDQLPTIGGVLSEMIVVEENTDYTLCKVPVNVADNEIMNLMVIYRYDTPIDSTDSEQDISFDGSYQILGLEREANSAMPSRNVYTLDQCVGLTVVPVFDQVNFPDGSDDGTFTGKDGFDISTDLEIGVQDLPAGRYAATFSVTDVFGKTRETEMTAFDWDGKNAVFDVPEQETGSQAEDTETETDAGEASEPAA